MNYPTFQDKYARPAATQVAQPMAADNQLAAPMTNPWDSVPQAQAPQATLAPPQGAQGVVPPQAPAPQQSTWSYAGK